MSTEGKRRRKKSSQFDLLFIPVDDASSPRKFRVSRLALWLLSIGTVMLSAIVVIVLLMYTPVGAFVPISNPALERKYGRQIIETQERLSSLADQIAVLSKYNEQLRSALGEGEKRDSSTAQPTARHQREEIRAEVVLPNPQTTRRGDGEPTTHEPAHVVTKTASLMGAFPLLLPVEGVVTQGFDPAQHHFGVDIASKPGTPVYAAAQGYVVFAGWTYEDGNVMILSHGGGYATVYRHNQTLVKSKNTFVKRGELIALVGNTGQTSQGPHLHFEVLKDGIPHNPNEFLLTPTRM